jgi:hypothetical protein
MRDSTTATCRCARSRSAGNPPGTAGVSPGVSPALDARHPAARKRGRDARAPRGLPLRQVGQISRSEDQVSRSEEPSFSFRGTKFLVPRNQVSRSEEPGFSFREPGFWSQGTRFLVPRTRFLVPGDQVSRSRDQVSRSADQVSRSEDQVSRSRNQFFRSVEPRFWFIETTQPAHFVRFTDQIPDFGKSTAFRRRVPSNSGNNRRSDNAPR